MRPVTFGLVAGLAFGLFDVLLMVPLDIVDKRTAMVGAFLSRFAIGFLIPLVALPIPGVAKGALIGLLISLPDAVITRSYAPILATGLVGGALIGWLASRKQS